MKSPAFAFDPVAAGLLLATVVLLSLGQVLFKVAATSLQLSDPRTFLSWPLLSALVLYAVATATWLAVLARLPLSVAFPFYGLTFVLVPLLAHRVLREPVGIASYVGGALILAGIAVSAHGLRR
jgi:multidrug transporter EmrE-like cation transporter